MLDYSREGDTIIIMKLDRGFRDIQHAVETAKLLKQKGVALILKDLGDMDLSSPAGELIFNIFASVAHFERARMKERQAVGIAKAKEQGKYKTVGRKKTVDNDRIKRLFAEGKSKAALAKEMNINRQTVYRALATV